MKINPQCLPSSKYFNVHPLVSTKTFKLHAVSRKLGYKKAE